MSWAHRYHFNILTPSKLLLDEEGTELPSLARARAEAIQDARSMMSIAILEGRDISDRSVQICDEAGKVLMVVPFSEAVFREG